MNEAPVEKVIDAKPVVKIYFRGKRMMISAGRTHIILYRDQVIELSQICNVFLMETDEKLQKEIKDELLNGNLPTD